MDAAARAEQEISAITTHTHTHTQQRKGKRKIDRMPQLTKWFIEDSGHGDNHRTNEVRVRNVWEMLANICSKSTNQQGENGATNQGQQRGDVAWASEKNFMWQVKWKFLHKSKLKVLKIAKGLKLNFTILTSAKGWSRGGKRVRYFFGFVTWATHSTHSYCPHPRALL